MGDHDKCKGCGHARIAHHPDLGCRDSVPKKGAAGYYRYCDCEAFVEPDGD